MDRQEALQDFYDLAKRGAALGPAAAMDQQRLFRSYCIWCYKKIFGAFEFTGFPDSWDYDYFLTTLFTNGIIAITDTDLGVLPLACGVAGVNVFNHPTRVVIANAVLGSFERSLEGDGNLAALVKLQYNYSGCDEIVFRYAAMLAQCDSSIYVNLRNSKVSFIGFVADKQQATTMQKLYEDIDSGKPAVYVKKDSVSEEDIYYNHVRETFIANDIELLKEHIKDSFLTEVGLNNANTEKRERLIVDEVNANNYEIRANVQHWLDTIGEGLDRANELFGLNLAVRLRKFDMAESGGMGSAELENA